MAFTMVSIVGCSLMIWWISSIGTKRILLFPLSGFVLMSSYHYGMDLLTNQFILGFLGMLLLIGSQRVDVRSLTLLEAEVV